MKIKKRRREREEIRGKGINTREKTTDGKAK